MKRVITTLFLAGLLVSSTSCNDQFLDKQPLDQFSEDAVWNDPALIQTFVNNIYFGLPHGFSNMMLASLTDESMYNADFGSSNVTKSLVTPSDYQTWDFWSGRRYKGMIWSEVYRYIRSTNLYLERIDAATFDDKALKDRLTGEVHFLRAYLYHNLVSVYGGVPIVTKAYGLSDDFQVPRDTYEACIKFISDECDKAATLLPLVQSGSEKGRATKGAALALKSRVLLYAASDFANNPSWAAGYKNPELIAYVGGSRQARWQAAKNAAKAVMDLGVYSLYKATPDPKDTTGQAYGELFLSRDNVEDIYVRQFTNKVYDQDSWDGYNPGLYNNPNGYHGWGSNTPLGQLVDSYEMKDGSKFSWSNPAHAANPYVGRDPRFYATILYEGAQWRKRPADVAASDPKGVIQVGYWEKAGANGQVEVIPGLDTRKGPIEDWNGTYSGYYLKKFIDPTIDAQYVKQDIPWRFIRYTEILLNYAEACIGLGQEAEAKQYINLIRNRANMPAITDAGAALVERYRNERRIEMAYEDQRFFDVRRWLIAPQTYTNAQGVDVRYKLNADKTTATKPTFKVIEVQDRGWKDRAYLLPIRLDEMNRNSKLIQNPLFD